MLVAYVEEVPETCLTEKHRMAPARVVDFPIQLGHGRAPSWRTLSGSRNSFGYIILQASKAC